jgi:hypothetical protein
MRSAGLQMIGTGNRRVHLKSLKGCIFLFEIETYMAKARCSNALCQATYVDCYILDTAYASKSV